MQSSKFATLTSWSYSAYRQYIQCALSIYFEKIARIRIAEPPSPVLDKGNRVHKEAELYVASHTDKKPPRLSDDLKLIKDKLIGFRKLKAVVEGQWAFTVKYVPVDWWSPDAWLRMKVDVCVVDPPLIQIVDYKTGRVHEEHKQQRSLYALGGLRLAELGRLPGGKDAVVRAEHLYTDTGQTAAEEFPMKKLPALKREWETRVREMMTDTKYRPTPGYHCRWCKFRKSNAGPCKENQ